MASPHTDVAGSFFNAMSQRQPMASATVIAEDSSSFFQFVHLELKHKNVTIQLQKVHIH